MYFLKCILCDTPNVTYAMQECIGKIEFMAKMSTPTYFLTTQTLGPGAEPRWGRGKAPRR